MSKTNPTTVPKAIQWFPPSFKGSITVSEFGAISNFNSGFWLTREQFETLFPSVRNNLVCTCGYNGFLTLNNVKNTRTLKCGLCNGNKSYKYWVCSMRFHLATLHPTTFKIDGSPEQIEDWRSKLVPTSSTYNPNISVGNEKEKTKQLYQKDVLQSKKTQSQSTFLSLGPPQKRNSPTSKLSHPSLQRLSLDNLSTSQSNSSQTSSSLQGNFEKDLALGNDMNNDTSESMDHEDAVTFGIALSDDEMAHELEEDPTSSKNSTSQHDLIELNQNSLMTRETFVTRNDFIQFSTEMAQAIASQVTTSLSICFHDMKKDMNTASHQIQELQRQNELLRQEFIEKEAENERKIQSAIMTATQEMQKKFEEFISLGQLNSPTRAQPTPTVPISENRFHQLEEVDPVNNESSVIYEKDESRNEDSKRKHQEIKDWTDVEREEIIKAQKLTLTPSYLNLKRIWIPNLHGYNAKKIRSVLSLCGTDMKRISEISKINDVAEVLIETDYLSLFTTDILGPLNWRVNLNFNPLNPPHAERNETTISLALNNTAKRYAQIIWKSENYFISKRTSTFYKRIVKESRNSQLIERVESIMTQIKGNPQAFFPNYDEEAVVQMNNQRRLSLGRNSSSSKRQQNKTSAHSTVSTSTPSTSALIDETRNGSHPC
jgi:hypothetical protein